MPSLHPETEKAIAEGPNMRLRWGTYESPREFARRVAMIEQQKMLATLRDSFIDVLLETDATWSNDEAEGVADEAILRRKP